MMVEKAHAKVLERIDHKTARTEIFNQNSSRRQTEGSRVSERSRKQAEREKVIQIILSQLRKGRKYRLQLHHECCRQLGYDTIALYNDNGNLSQTCEGMTDYTFDSPLKELLKSRKVRRHRGNREDGQTVMFYELTENAVGVQK